MINPEKPLLNDTSKTVIISPDGTAASYPTTLISDADAKLLREYKKWMQRNGYKEALYCNRCFEMNLHDGTEAWVTGDKILIKCRCRVQYYQGATY